jgi:mannose-6-phosphate isomerase-like protein (cupin superfamily)
MVLFKCAATPAWSVFSPVKSHQNRWKGEPVVIIKATGLPEIREEGYPLVMKKIVHADDHSKDISITWVSIWGHHKKMVCEVSDRAYYIIDGHGEFTVGNDPPGKVTGGDYVFIPRGVPYVFDGTMTYLVMNGPAFVPGSDQVLE